MRPVRPLLIACAALAALLLPPASAAGLSYPVTSNADTTGTGTLRWAIEEANGRMGADSIPIGATGAIRLKTALPPITDHLTIAGPGPKELAVERDAAAPFRIFDFGPGITSSLGGLTVRGGAATSGGGISNDNGTLTLTGVIVTGNEASESGTAQAEALGGGIYSFGTLTLRESTVSGNVAVAADGPTFTVARGGGLYAEGPVTIDRSTFSDNEASAAGNGAEDVFAVGGGLDSLGATDVERSTVSGNVVLASEGDEVGASGGGLQGNDIALTSSTVTANTAEAEGEALGSNIGPVPGGLIRNTIVSDPRGGAESCSEPLDSGGFNLDEDGSCEFAQPTDLANVAAGLDPVLRDNGGPTPTHALLETSLALDRGSAFGSAVDQRDLRRPVDLSTRSNSEGGDGSDIGAFELQSLLGGDRPSPTPILVTAVAGDRTPPNTRIISGPPRVTFGQLATFRFNSTESQSRFQCKIDNRRWRGCRSPLRWKVGAGRKHLFKVRAIDRFGNVDRTPARFGWRVKRVGG